MACPKFEKYETCKDPDSLMDYGRNWGPFTEEDGITLNAGWLISDDIIVGSLWDITSDNEEIPTLLISTSKPPEISIDGLKTLVWLEGGTVGIKYNLKNRITTLNGRIEERTGIISLVEK